MALPPRRAAVVGIALGIYVGIVALFVGAITMTLRGGEAGGVGFGPRVAIVELDGVILDADDLLKDLRSLRDNPLVKAVVLRINSPGGVVAPTQELHQAVLRLREAKKPVVASLGA